MMDPGLGYPYLHIVFQGWPGLYKGLSERPVGVSSAVR